MRRNNKGQFLRTTPDLTGNKYNNWTVLGYSNKTEKDNYWNCACICGTRRTIAQRHLVTKTGGSKSCGCIKKSPSNKTHGETSSHLYKIWIGIKQRCEYIKCPSYKYYGAKGVKIDQEWKDFSKFKDWCILNNWKPGLHICRKKDQGNYSNLNCYIDTPINNFRDKPSNKMNLVRAKVVKNLWDNTKLSQQKIADLYHVNRGTIKNIIRGYTWLN